MPGRRPSATDAAHDLEPLPPEPDDEASAQTPDLLDPTQLEHERRLRERQEALDRLAAQLESVERRLEKRQGELEERLLRVEQYQFASLARPRGVLARTLGPVRRGLRAHRLIPSRAVLADRAEHGRILLRRSRETIRSEGALEFVRRTRRWFELQALARELRELPIDGAYSIAIESRYARWLKELDPSDSELAAQRERAPALAYRPLVSIVVPVFDPPEPVVRKMAESALAQTYDRWELCIANAGASADVRQFLDDLAANDARVRVAHLESNGGISVNSNAALEIAEGEFVALVDHDDVLAPHALFAIVDALNEDPELDVLYSDEDRLMPNGRRVLPFLKPDWSPELLHSFMYTGHLTVYRRQLVEAVGRFRSEFDGSQDYDLMLRISAKTGRIRHIPQVLYHWRMLPESAAAGGKSEARRTNIAALDDAIRSQGRTASVTEYPFANRVEFELVQRPLVSIVIPSDDFDAARTCVLGLHGKTRYERFEILVVTNSGVGRALELDLRDAVRVIRFDEPFNFSAKCNLGAQHAAGDYLVFLNDDVVPLTNDWIESLLQYAQLPEVAGVSPKLLHEDDSIQYAGLVTGVRDLVGTAFLSWPRWDPSYHRLAISVRNTSCLSGACMMVRADELARAGGWDAENVPISHSDFDLSFRLAEHGQRLVYTPFAELRHFGNRSRGSARMDPKAHEARADGGADQYMLARWGDRMARDPFFPETMRKLVYHDESNYEVVAPPPRSLEDEWWQKPRVLVVSHELSLSGAPIMLLEVAEALADAGMLVAVCAPVHGPLADAVTASGLPLIIDDAILSHPERADLSLKRYDVVVAGTVHGWRVIEHAKTLEKTTVWCIQESKFGVELLHDVRAEAAFEYADRIVFPSEHAAEVFEEFGGPRPSVIHYGIPDVAETVQPAARAGEPESLKLAWVGAVEPRKAPHVLLDAIDKLPADIHDRVEAVIAGRILFPRYGQQLRGRSDGTLVRLLGEIPREEALAHVASADVFVCTSRDESGPVVVLEAMALGRAVVSTDVGFVSEILTDGVDGLIVPIDDPTALSRALERLAREPELRRRLGDEARRTYERGFRVERYARDIVQLVEQALDERSTAAIGAV